MIELKSTIDGMISNDYKDRFVAEYTQLKIRYTKLKALNSKLEAHDRLAYCQNPCCRDVAKPEHDCPPDLLRDQQRIMGEYLHILEVRGVIEGIDLSEVL